MSKKQGIRAVAYPRYSSDNQREESIIAQLRAIEEYCKQNGYTLVDVYPDEEKTGTTDKRPSFQRMIADSAKKLFDVVIVHKLDRFARNRYDSAHYKRILKRNGVRVESVLERLDGSPESVIMTSLLEGMAEYYSLNLAREVRKGLSENALNGIHTGGRPPYGLKVNKETRKLEIDERTAPAVRIYFEGIDADRSLEAIAAQINQQGFRTQENRPFGKNSFDGWARNRKYRGDYVWDQLAGKDEDGVRHGDNKPIEEQTIIPGIIPAIIEAALWDRVNAKMDTRKRGPGRMKAKINYLLTGKIYCGNCGALYAGNSYTNTKSSERTVLTYYKCQGKCGNTSVRKDAIEALAAENLVDTCFSEAGMREIVSRVQVLYQEERKQTANEVEPIKQELKEITTTIENWINALGKGVRGLEDRISEAQNRQEALEYALQRAELLSKIRQLDENRIIDVINAKKHSLLSAEDDDKKAVLQEYVDQIVIQPSKDINNFDAEITYRVFSGGAELTLLKTLQTSYRK